MNAFQKKRDALLGMFLAVQRQFFRSILSWQQAAKLTSRYSNSKRLHWGEEIVRPSDAA